MPAYQFLPLHNTDAHGVSYLCGHAIIWDPRRVRMELIISRESLRRDWALKTSAPFYRQVEPWKELEPLPAPSVRESVRQSPGGRAYFNAGESGVMINPLVQDGRLLTKPEGARAVMQKEWAPLNDVFTFFLQHADGRVEIRDLRIAANRIYPEDLKHLRPGTNGFSVPYLLKQGQRVPLKNPPPGETSKSGETLYTLGAPAALSAVGLSGDGYAAWVGLIGDVADLTNWERAGTEADLARCLVDLGVTDAVFAGASGDVQYYDGDSQMLVAAAERPKSADRRWILKPGQTERGLTCIAKLVDGAHAF